MPSRLAAQASGATELIGPGDPPGQHAHSEDADDEDGTAAAAVADVPSAYSADVAAMCV